MVISKNVSAYYEVWTRKQIINYTKWQAHSPPMTCQNFIGSLMCHAILQENPLPSKRSKPITHKSKPHYRNQPPQKPKQTNKPPLHSIRKIKIKMAMAVEGGTLSEIYQSAKKGLLRARDGVEKLERLESSTSSGGYDSPELSYAVKKDIAQIQSLCVEMDRLWRSVAAKSQRDLWKR